MKKNNFLVVFWIFVIGGVMGYVFETVWCYFAFGGFSSRTSNFFFPFSIVWAFGAVIMSCYLKRNKDHSMILVFIKGCVLSALFEFLCGYMGKEANSVVACFFDRYYSDHIISLYFPKMKEVH